MKVQILFRRMPIVTYRQMVSVLTGNGILVVQNTLHNGIEVFCPTMADLKLVLQCIYESDVPCKYDLRIDGVMVGCVEND